MLSLCKILRTKCLFILQLFKIINQSNANNEVASEEKPQEHNENPEIKEEKEYQDSYNLPKNEFNKQQVLKERNSDTQGKNQTDYSAKSRATSSNVSSSKHVSTSKGSKTERTKSPISSSFKQAPLSYRESPADEVQVKTKFIAKRRKVVENTEDYDTFLEIVGDMAGIRPKRMTANNLQE